MSVNRSRLLPALGLVIAGGLFLTACAGDDSAASDPKAPVGAAKAVGQSKTTTKTGTLTYLAPGKLMVGDRAFWVAGGTQVWGSGGICGDGSGQVAVECTTAQLEKAAKKGTVKAEVVIGKDGVATQVRDQTPAKGSGNGGSGGGATEDNRKDGTVTGVLTYLAPGKLNVGSRPFWVADDTRIWGAGGICGDGSGQVAAECTTAQLEKAAKTGTVKAAVTIRQGIATDIREQ